MRAHDAKVASEGRHPAAVQNAVLATLSPQAFERLRMALTTVELRRHAIIHDMERPVDTIYFVESGAISCVASTRTDAPIEIAMVGHHGFVGISVVLGVRKAAHRAVVQIPGTALVISATELEEAMSALPEIREHLLRSVNVLMSQQAQAVLCCAKHALNQRLARALLFTHDWVSGNPVPLTHDVLAAMLGAWRPNVSDALAVLEHAGVIEKTRGAIRIIDGAVLAKQACECHRVVSEKFRSAWHGSTHRYDRHL